MGSEMCIRDRFLENANRIRSHLSRNRSAALDEELVEMIEYRKTLVDLKRNEQVDLTLLPPLPSWDKSSWRAKYGQSPPRPKI